MKKNIAELCKYANLIEGYPDIKVEFKSWLNNKIPEYLFRLTYKQIVCTMKSDFSRYVDTLYQLKRNVIPMIEMFKSPSKLDFFVTEGNKLYKKGYRLGYVLQKRKNYMVILNSVEYKSLIKYGRNSDGLYVMKHENNFSDMHIISSGKAIDRASFCKVATDINRYSSTTGNAYSDYAWKVFKNDRDLLKSLMKEQELNDPELGIAFFALSDIESKFE